MQIRVHDGESVVFVHGIEIGIGIGSGIVSDLWTCALTDLWNGHANDRAGYGPLRPSCHHRCSRENGHEIFVELNAVGRTHPTGYC